MNGKTASSPSLLSPPSTGKTRPPFLCYLLQRPLTQCGKATCAVAELVLLTITCNLLSPASRTHNSPAPAPNFLVLHQTTAKFFASAVPAGLSLTSPRLPLPDESPDSLVQLGALVDRPNRTQAPSPLRRRVSAQQLAVSLAARHPPRRPARHLSGRDTLVN